MRSGRTGRSAAEEREPLERRVRRTAGGPWTAGRHQGCRSRPRRAAGPGPPPARARRPGRCCARPAWRRRAPRRRSPPAWPGRRCGAGSPPPRSTPSPSRPAPPRSGSRPPPPGVARPTSTASSTAALGQHHGELLAPGARHQVDGRAPLASAAPATCRSTASPAAWPDRLVELAEAIDVEQQQREGLAEAGRPARRSTSSLAKNWRRFCTPVRVSVCDSRTIDWWSRAFSMAVATRRAAEPMSRASVSSKAAADGEAVEHHADAAVLVEHGHGHRGGRQRSEREPRTAPARPPPAPPAAPPRRLARPARLPAGRRRPTSSAGRPATAPDHQVARRRVGQQEREGLGRGARRRQLRHPCGSGSPGPGCRPGPRSAGGAAPAPAPGPRAAP